MKMHFSIYKVMGTPSGELQWPYVGGDGPIRAEKSPELDNKDEEVGYWIAIPFGRASFTSLSAQASTRARPASN